MKEDRLASLLLNQKKLRTMSVVITKSCVATERWYTIVFVGVIANGFCYDYSCTCIMSHNGYCSVTIVIRGSDTFVSLALPFSFRASSMHLFLSCSASFWNGTFQSCYFYPGFYVLSNYLPQFFHGARNLSPRFFLIFRSTLNVFTQKTRSQFRILQAGYGPL